MLGYRDYRLKTKINQAVQGVMTEDKRTLLGREKGPRPTRTLPVERLRRGPPRQRLRVPDVLAPGRGDTGSGGAVMFDVAREVLRADFPGLAARISLHMTSEQEKPHGQAMAAASLLSAASISTAAR